MGDEQDRERMDLGRGPYQTRLYDLELQLGVNRIVAFLHFWWEFSTAVCLFVCLFVC